MNHLSERLLADDGDSGTQQVVESAITGEIIVDPLQAGQKTRQPNTAIGRLRWASLCNSSWCSSSLFSGDLVL